MKFFRFDGPYSEFMKKVFDLVLLQLLWVVFSLPLITVGASTTALFSITMKMVKNEEPYIIKGYVASFRENFRESTVLIAAGAASALWAVLMLWLCLKGGGSVLRGIGIVYAGILFVFLVTLVYLFPVQARYNNTAVCQIRNSMRLGLMHLPFSILLLLIPSAFILLTAFVRPLFPVMIAFWIACGVSVTAYLQSFILNLVFAKNEREYKEAANEER